MVYWYWRLQDDRVLPKVFLSLVLVVGGLYAGWAGDYSLACQPVDVSDDPKALIMVKMVYLYFVAKFTEFLDTIFFVLRKKFNQVRKQNYCLLFFNQSVTTDTCSD